MSTYFLSTEKCQLVDEVTSTDKSDLSRNSRMLHLISLQWDAMLLLLSKDGAENFNVCVKPLHLYCIPDFDLH